MSGYRSPWIMVAYMPPLKPINVSIMNCDKKHSENAREIIKSTLSLLDVSLHNSNSYDEVDKQIP